MKTTELVTITGNTFPVKDSLKALGARWNPDRKCWMIAPEKADEASRIVAGSPAKGSVPFRPCKCQMCGKAPVRDHRGFVQYGTKILKTRFGFICGDCYEEAKMGF